MLCIFRSFGAVERVRSSRVDATKKARGEQTDIANGSGIGLHRRRLATLGGAGRKRVPPVVEPDVERAATVHVLLELGCNAEDQTADRRSESRKQRTNRGLSLRHLRELDDAAALRSGALEEDLRELDLASRLEKLDKIFVGS